MLEVVFLVALGFSSVFAGGKVAENVTKRNMGRYAPQRRANG